MPFFNKQYNDLVSEYWEKCIVRREIAPKDCVGLRPEIIDSWTRSLAYNVNPKILIPRQISAEELRNRQLDNALLLDVAHSYIDRIRKNSNFIHSNISIMDRDCIAIAHIIDDMDISESLVSDGLYLGNTLDEHETGTGCISMAFTQQKPVQLYGAEHYMEAYQKFYGVAAPIIVNGEVVGAISQLTLVEEATPLHLPLIASTALGIETEMVLRNRNHEMQVGIARTNMVLNQAGMGILVVNRQGTIVQCNSMACNMLGFPKDEVLGFDLTRVLAFPSSINLSASRLDYKDEELTFQLKDNRIVRLITTIQKTPEQNGEIHILFRRPIDIQRMVNRMAGYSAKYTFDTIVGDSKEIQAAKSMGKTVAKSDVNILITGESGTGKELFAQSIHRESSRAQEPFIAVNCAAIPNGLIESELFGYESGAFTGANRNGQIGKFELADKGTIFLDEIGCMPLDAQVKLLRVIQEKEITRVGGKTAKHIDVRIIAATNADLKEGVTNGSFRDDLYYRLNVISLEIPPLRKRVPDIKPLAESFAKHFSEKHNSEVSISDEAMSLLLRYPWPGNVRELENVMERAVVLVKEGTIDPSSLPANIVNFDPNAKIDNLTIEQTQDSTDERYVQILESIKISKGDVEKASKLLNIHPRTLYRRLNEYKINPKDYKH